ncbi:MAG: leucyl aminopeptidase family protein [Acidobacteria bacterium]|nr:leucyl aminopeptidase family protein [Acidobacteriota bacterium]
MAYGLVSQATESTDLIFQNQTNTQAQLKSATPLVQAECEAARFSGSWGQFAVLHRATGELDSIWLGQEQKPQDPRALLFLFADLGSRLPKGTYNLSRLPLQRDEMVQAALGWGLSRYFFDRYKKANNSGQGQLLIPESIPLQSITAQLDAIFLARNLVNTPASDLGPDEICDQARALADAHNAKLTIFRGESLLKENYPSIYAVGKGSSREPGLIDLVWGNPEHPTVTLVGKGVVFDSGGLNLKSASGMRLMKKDMGGAALVMALAQWVMSTQLPIHLRMLVPTVENSPGRNAYRPGDIITTRKGTTVEIDNTDAEGRVILCDPLFEAASESPDLLIDMATLTGACRVALGPDLPGFFTPSSTLADTLREASFRVADPVWQLPLWQPYRQMLDSQVADIANASSGGFAGSITAALYLHEFVKPVQNWIHVDAYAWNPKASSGHPVGGEATGLRAMMALLDSRYRPR